MDINELQSFRLADAVKFHDRLNPALWGSDEHLLPHVREKLLEIADDFREFLGITDLDIKDITISGSNAAYTYTPHSDIDLHIVADLPRGDTDDVYRELFDAKKYQYNDQHDFKIGGYDVELYVQNANEPHHSQGIYSLKNNDWVRVPSRRRPKVDDISVKSKYEDLGHRIDQAIESGDLERMDAMARKIRDMRQAGLDRNGEFGPENLAFKVMRNNGTLERLRTARTEAKNRLLSLDEAGRKKKKKRYSYGGYWFPGYGYYTSTTAENPDTGDDGVEESINTPTPTAMEIMKKHGMSEEDFIQRIKLGIAAELAHVDNTRQAIDIAMSHINDVPDYYDQAKKPTLNESPEDIVGELNRFADFCVKHLDVQHRPQIRLKRDPAWSERNKTFGRYDPDTNTLYLSTAGRHVVDIMRTMAHELTHHRQEETDSIPDDAGDTGSAWENEANARAGVIMRDYADQRPDLFGDPDISEGWREKAAALGAAACIAGTPGCATMPDAREVARTVQTIGRGAQSLEKMGQAGAEEEARQELKNWLRRQGGHNTPPSRLPLPDLPKQQKENIQTPVSRDQKSHDDYYYKFVTAKARAGRPLSKHEQEFLKLYHIKRLANQQVAEASGYIPTKAQANDPRFKMALTVDIQPGETGRQANKLKLKTDSQGRPQTAKANGLFENLYREYKRYKADEDYSPDEPPGPEFPPTMPAGTVKVDVSDVYDWYKLGQHISNLKGLGKHDFGAGPPSTIISFGDEETEHKYIQDLEKTGLTTTDIDPKDPNQPRGMKRQKTDPTYNVDETIQAPINKSQDAEQYYKFIVGKARLGRPLTRAEQDYVKMYQMYRKQKLAEDSEEQDLMEVKMSPSALEAWARSPEAEGIQAGFEAEMIFRDASREEDNDPEPDYDYDTRPDYIDEVIDFFSNDDWGYGLTRSGAQELREQLWNDFLEWQDEQIGSEWDERESELVREYMERELLDDTRERDTMIHEKLTDSGLSDDEADAIIKHVDGLTRDEKKNRGEDDEMYTAYQAALEEVKDTFEERVEQSISDRDEYYDNAREEFSDMMKDDGEFDESSWFRDDLRYMSDIENRYSLDWPYWSGSEYNGGGRSPDDVASSLSKALGGADVIGSSGYHSTTRKPGRWIVEPDSSLEPDDGDEAGLEIVSPPMPLPQALESLKKVIEWGNGAGDAYTNSSTGLHMGVSIPYKGGDVDYVKLVLFMGDQYILDKFGRASNHYCDSAMKKLKQNINIARSRGDLKEEDEVKKLDPAAALDLIKKNLIELAHRYVQDGVGNSKYTSAHIKPGYIEFRSPGGDYLSLADRDDEGMNELRNTMLRFARAMQIAGRPDLERKEYAKKLTKLIGSGAENNDALRLFADYSAGDITPDQLKKRWADAVLRKELPQKEQPLPNLADEFEVFNTKTGQVIGDIDTFGGRRDALSIAIDRYRDRDDWSDLDLRQKNYEWDVINRDDDQRIDTISAPTVSDAENTAQTKYPNIRIAVSKREPEPKEQPKLSRRAQVAKKIAERPSWWKVSSGGKTIFVKARNKDDAFNQAEKQDDYFGTYRSNQTADQASEKDAQQWQQQQADNQQDSQEIQARIGEPRPAVGPEPSETQGGREHNWRIYRIDRPDTYDVVAADTRTEAAERWNVLHPEDQGASVDAVPDQNSVKYEVSLAAMAEVPDWSGEGDRYFSPIAKYRESTGQEEIPVRRIWATDKAQALSKIRTYFRDFNDIPDDWLKIGIVGI